MYVYYRQESQRTSSRTRIRGNRFGDKSNDGDLLSSVHSLHHNHESSAYHLLASHDRYILVAFHHQAQEENLGMRPVVGLEDEGNCYNYSRTAFHLQAQEDLGVRPVVGHEEEGNCYSHTAYCILRTEGGRLERNPWGEGHV